jgi:limonene-1,2-epoxide hydrolase
MTQTGSPALAVAMAYYEAWTAGDMDRAMTYVADGIVCDAPVGRVEGAERYRAFLAPFAQMLTGSDLIAAFGDEQTALMMYDPHTTLVQSAPTGEWFRVEDRKIVQSRLVFDRTPFDAARQAAASAAD